VSTVALKVWQAGQVSVLPTPDGYSSEADGMNRLGDVVGYVAPTGGGARTPALWRAGMLIQLGTASPSNDAMAFDINDAGLIVGEVQEQPGIGDIQAVAWSADAPGTFSYVPGGFDDDPLLGDRGRTARRHRARRQ
jgi:uncharacterized membrane protein